MSPAQTAELARILDRARSFGLTEVDSHIATEGPERILIVSGKRNGEPVEMSFVITTDASIDMARSSGLTDVVSRIETEGPERILIVSGKRNGEPVEMSFVITTDASIDMALRLLGTATDAEAGRRR